MQKNSGLNLEHAYSDDGDWAAYYLLLQIAHLLLQLVEKGSLLRRLAKRRGSDGGGAVRQPEEHGAAAGGEPAQSALAATRRSAGADDPDPPGQQSALDLTAVSLQPARVRRQTPTEKEKRYAALLDNRRKPEGTARPLSGLPPLSLAPHSLLFPPFR